MTDDGFQVTEKRVIKKTFGQKKRQNKHLAQPNHQTGGDRDSHHGDSQHE